jgi:uncharacterized protein YcgL (UPF0745 family)
MLCQVYKSLQRAEMYLYVEKTNGLASVPEALLKRFGEPEKVMLLLLDGKKKLARADVELVREGIRDKGFYLQMPPGKNAF